ncbi:hypothetical protein VNO78_34097 [Psophocarpus tetragonolobus]|uniref:Telomeric single stranded DNA binding POT1/Cdc13 domain-containing protein n=1 Tax=Psophocarpus tetragonolobus TaxID=3891 RepID=A0AAN9NYI4_PSOTE
MGANVRFLALEDASAFLEKKVNFIAIVLDCGFSKPTKGTDYCCSLRIIDETRHQTGMTVNIFTKREENLPILASLGDVIQLCRVQVKVHDGDVNAVFNKKFSSFALYEGKDCDDFHPYQVSSLFRPNDDDKVFVDRLRKWRVNFKFHEGLVLFATLVWMTFGRNSNNFPMLREIKGEYPIDLVCKILHIHRTTQGDWIAFAWDGTDTPPNVIHAKLEDELNSPLRLQQEPEPLAEDLLCTFPKIGSIIRLNFDFNPDMHIHLLKVNKWIKFINLLLYEYDGLWNGSFSTHSKLRYTSEDDYLIIERQRLFDARLSLFLRMPSRIFPKPSPITVVDQDHTTLATLMTVLTHREGTARFKCIVRVVAAMPLEAVNLRTPAVSYKMRLTLEDSTARIHAFLVNEQMETFFGGNPSIDNLTRKFNRLLGVGEGSARNEIDEPSRNPPWVCVCIETNVYGSRPFKIYNSSIVFA